MRIGLPHADTDPHANVVHMPNSYADRAALHLSADAAPNTVLQQHVRHADTDRAALHVPNPNSHSDRKAGPLLEVEVQDACAVPD